MTKIRQLLKDAINSNDLRDVSIRAVGRLVTEPGQKEVQPETVKYHWKRLFEAGDVDYLYDGSVSKPKTSKIDAKLPSGNSLVSIPVFGAADCGPATRVATEDDLGNVTVSTSLLDTKKYDTLYALIADGESMNATSIKGKPINDGDYVIVDASRVAPKSGDCVVAIVDGLANIKRFYQEQDRIVLASESDKKYDPIFIPFEDQSDSLIGGTVIQVIEKPKYMQEYNR